MKERLYCSRIRGDAMFYQGSNVIHWRERLAGKSARQIFIHYIHKDDPMYERLSSTCI